MDRLDRQQIEVASWRLASDLMRRHPREARLVRGHPGGGQYDLLWLLGIGSDADVRLNRAGTIQVASSVRRGEEAQWLPTSWVEYATADRLQFVQRLERAVGWDSPARGRPATATTLTYRVISGLVESLVADGHRVDVEQGLIDTSGDGGGRNPRLDAFPVPVELLAARPGDLFGESGYRFWIIVIDGQPVLVLEQSTATVITREPEAVLDLMVIYRASGNNSGAVVRRVLAEASVR